MTKKWKLMGTNGQTYESDTPGALGGHRRSHIYGSLSCRVALRAIAAGGYVTHRVFFKDEAAAVAAGYRPCAACMPEEYAVWKARQSKSKKDVKNGQTFK
jgi:methylphosphotriester-DNA--protein-cysteine methyltransferase